MPLQPLVPAPLTYETYFDTNSRSSTVASSTPRDQWITSHLRCPRSSSVPMRPQCSYCGKTHTRPVRYQECQNRHTGTRPFACQASCGQSDWYAFFGSPIQYRYAQLILLSPVGWHSAAVNSSDDTSFRIILPTYDAYDGKSLPKQSNLNSILPSGHIGWRQNAARHRKTCPCSS